MKPLLPLLLIPLCACAADSPKAVEPTTQSREMYGKSTWMQRHEQVLAYHRAVKPEIVFIGDSITHFWAGEPAAHHVTNEAAWQKASGGRVATNMGFGFDYIENALWRVQHGELDGIAPKVIVINLGTNNLGHKGSSPEACARAMQALLSAVRAKQPAAKVLLLGLYPRHETKLTTAITETNRRYAAFAGDGIRFLDIGAALAEPGKPTVPAKKHFSDGLHPNAAGYGVIAEKLAPVIAELAGPAKARPLATTPVSREGDSWWAQRNRSLATAAKAGAGACRVAFVGDSITQGWEAAGKARWAAYVQKDHAVNLGISGDRTEHVLWRLTAGNNLANGTLKPKTFVVHIGTNNSGQRTATETPEDIRDGVKAILDTLRAASPESKVVLMAIFPRSGPAHDINVRANTLLKPLADGRSVVWLDIGEKLAPGGRLDPSIMPDLLHLSPKGYEIWSEALNPLLEAGAQP